MNATYASMSEAARRVFALFEESHDCVTQRAALSWALAFVMRDKRGGREVVPAQMVAARVMSPRCHTLADVLAQTRLFGYVCDAVDRAPPQIPDAALPVIVLTVDGSTLVLTNRTYIEGKAEYTVHRFEASGRQFGATLDEAELMAMGPGLTLVLIPDRPGKGAKRRTDNVNAGTLA